MEEEVNRQSKATEGERTKRTDAVQTLKASKTDLTKAKEDLKDATREKDSALAGLNGAQQ